MSLITTALGLFAKPIGNILDKFVEDKDAKQQIEREIKLAILEKGAEFEAQAGRIILAEAQSEHFLTASWRPIAALMMTLAIGINLILVPVAMWFGIDITYELPPQVWTTFNVMLGGYVVSRGAEKVASTLSKNK